MCRFDATYPIRILILLLILSGCSGKDSDEIEPNVNIILKISNLDAKDISTYSKDSKDVKSTENLITDCFVLLFDGNSNFINYKKIDVSKILIDSTGICYLPKFYFDISDGYKLYVICNTGLSSLPGGILTEKEINQKIKPAKNYYYEGEALPMSGMIVWDSYNTNVTMSVSVAKIVVKLDKSFNKVRITSGILNRINNRFDADKSCILVANYASKSNIMSNPLELSNNLTGNTSYYGTTSEKKFIYIAQNDNNQDSIAIYISEFPNSNTDFVGKKIDDDVFSEKRTFLLMFDKITSTESMIDDGSISNVWRMDFFDGKTGKYLDIKRNYLYTFIICNIESSPSSLYSFSTFKKNINKFFTLYQDEWYDNIDNIGYYIEVSETF
jgi:hypothetical protein